MRQAVCNIMGLLTIPHLLLPRCCKPIAPQPHPILSHGGMQGALPGSCKSTLKGRTQVCRDPAHDFWPFSPAADGLRPAPLVQATMQALFQPNYFAKLVLAKRRRFAVDGETQMQAAGGRWSVVVGGRWSVVGGRWSVVGGRWSVVGGRWSVVGGQRSAKPLAALR